jgi:glycosyltransferase involved in cell wall biosynthesis
MPVSVCMATYNGVDYIKEQLSTILVQLDAGDEVIVVDDASSDATLDVVRAFSDRRIRIVKNERNLGHVASFSRALALAQHDVIIMADQDDIWLPDRVRLMSAGLAGLGRLALASNSEFMRGSGAMMIYECEGVTSATSSDYAGNIWSIFTGRRRYYGCAMALRREFCKVILPIPAYVESHDLWIAMAGNMARANVHLDENTLVRRVHGNNASIISRPLVKKLWSRVIFAISYVDLWLRLRRA